MAVELVAGALLSASLQVLFERLASEEIPQLFQGKKSILKLLDKLNTRVLSANVLLNDAEEKQLRNDNVKKWLFKLQDVIFEADDLADRIDYEALRSKLEDGQSSSGATKVFNQLKSMSPFLSTFDKTVQRDVIEILDKLDDLLDQKDALGLREVAENAPSKRPPAPLVEESDVFGRDTEKETIVDLLLKEDVDGGTKISVIPIVGMGGLGKTTLAQLVYDDDRVRKHFELKVWVTVSDEFDISKITKEIFEGVTSNKCDIENSEELRRKLKEALQGKKFLFVHDDVWNESYTLWGTLKSYFDYGANGSKIIVTTRSTIVASTMTTGHIHHLQTLLYKDCWNLFVKHAFGTSVDINDFPDLQELGKKIVDKCKGLPLAIISLGGLLRSERNTKKWEDILNSDTWEELYKKEGSILPALWLSYCHLPGHLKQCFAYCSIFPKDCEIEREKLILLWMAEGFLPHDKKCKRIEEYGEEYLQDLMSRLDLSNDLLRLGTMTRHLSYVKVKYNINKVKGLYKAKSLRTILALPFQRGYCFKGLNLVSQDMLFAAGSCLRVLSFNESSIEELPNSIGNLKHLRYLDLSYTKIKELPESVCTLYNLQTLLLLKCRRLCQLPKKMGSLINLRYLEISGVCLKEFPHEISNMKHLYFLSNVVLSDGNSGGFKMKRVAELENLRCISGLENISNAREALEANLQAKKSLSKLTLSWNGNAGEADSSQKEKDILDALEPHANLEHLGIKNYKGTTFSDWIVDSAFVNLVSISIVNCKNCCILPPLGQLAFLKDLKIKGWDSVISIGDEIPHHNGPLFSCLEDLSISNMLEWKDWSFSSEAMQQGQIFPLLTTLRLYNCPKLNVALPGYLPSLKDVSIWRCEQMVVWLPRTQQTVTTPLSLVHVYIDNWPLLESVLDLGSHSKVRSLELACSKRFLENHKQWDLHRLSSLKSLSFTFWEDDSFPDVGLLPTTLTSLDIGSSRNLETLNGKALQQLTSLESLYIQSCRRLRCLPEEGLPTSLSYLLIRGCPLVKQRCEKGGEDWPKIQHITEVELVE